MRQVLDALLRARDAELQQEHAGVGSRAVTRAMQALASLLAEGGHLPHHQADEVVQHCLPESQRGSIELLERLRGWGLVRTSPPPSDSGEPTDDLVDIAFDRLRHHLLAERLTSALATNDMFDADTCNVIVERAVADPGLAQALSLVLPERCGRELLDFAVDENTTLALMEPWIESLPWRTSTSLGTRARRWVVRALGSSTTIKIALDAIVTLAVRPGHALDRRFLHRTLDRLAMADRDAVLCPYLHSAFEDRARSPLQRLLLSAWNPNVDSIGVEVLDGWLTVLCWCFAAADRRVRDHATKAAVQLTTARPIVWRGLLERFIEVDDDYVLERCLCAAYGALVRNPDYDAVSEVTRFLASREFGTERPPRPNALIRDHMRCIGELALHLDLLDESDIAPFRPPYDSDWPLEVPTEADLEPYSQPDRQRDYPRLYESCIDSFLGDFAIYTVKRCLTGYEHGLPPDLACRWIFRHVLDLGYTPARFANYDLDMIHRFGSGRGRPKWADRIGKKYQWIALGRLLAHVKDHVDWRGGEYETAPLASALQGDCLRDIDPTILRRDPTSDSRETTTSWWVSEAFEVHVDSDVSDEDWVRLDDAPDLRKLLDAVPNPGASGQRWRVLSAYLGWIDRDGDSADCPYRDVWMQVHGYFVPREQLNRCWAWLRKQDFFGRWMKEGRDYEGDFYIGEYPWAPGFREAEEERDHENETGSFDPRPVANDVTISFEGDSWQEGAIHAHVPSQDLVTWTGSRWDGRSGFVDASGRRVFFEPALEYPGPGRRALLVDEDTLQTTLERHGLALVWTILWERRVIGGPLSMDDFKGTKRFSRVCRLEASGPLRISKKSVGEYTEPDGTVHPFGPS